MTPWFWDTVYLKNDIKTSMKLPINLTFVDESRLLVLSWNNNADCLLDSLLTVVFSYKILIQDRKNYHKKTYQQLFWNFLHCQCIIVLQSLLSDQHWCPTFAVTFCVLERWPFSQPTVKKRLERPARPLENFPQGNMKKKW